MPLPSLTAVARDTGRVLVRFPFAVGSALVAAAAGLVAVQAEAATWRWGSTQSLLLAALLGIPLFVALRLVFERLGTRAGVYSALLSVGGVALLAAVYRHLNDNPGSARFLRYAQLSLVAHLGVSVGPWLFGASAQATTTNGFWQFNRRLFLRALLSTLYSTCLYVGLALALAGVHQLLGIQVRFERYLQLYVLIALAFHPLHFLAGVPEDLAALERDTSFPRGLRVFCQFVLLPLVALYLAILYAYLAKILATHSWPHGYIGWLVSAASVLGMLTLLLLYPLEQRAGGDWVRLVRRGLHAALLPLLLLLFLAVRRRASEYGLTEPRYFLWVLGAWLFGLSLYLMLGGPRNIRLVPLTLALLALLTFAGPWGAYTVSLRSQSARLERLLAENHLLQDGKLTGAPASSVPPEDRRELSAAALYLAETHDPAVLNRWSHTQRHAPPRSTPARYGNEPGLIAAQDFMYEAGVGYFNSRGEPVSIYYYTDRDECDIRGYAQLVNVDLYDTARDGVPPALHEPGRYAAQLAPGLRSVDVLRGEERVLSVPLEALIAHLSVQRTTETPVVAAAELVADAETEHLRARICFTRINTELAEGEQTRIKSASGHLLLAER